jgi:hypothetical protein
VSRPGHLSGFTQFDGAAYFGNAVRLVHAAIAHRNFATIQPPGGTIPGHGALPRAGTRPAGAEHEGPGADRTAGSIVYQAREHQDSWLMVGYGLQYYLARDMPNGLPVPHELFIARTAAQAGTLYPELCQRPAACLGAEPRIWVIGVGRQTSPYQAVTPAQAAVLRPRYRLSLVKHQRSLTMFLLTRAENPARSGP